MSLTIIDFAGAYNMPAMACYVKHSLPSQAKIEIEAIALEMEQE
jgi:enamine deaminase RidA (YjgF/YER057c/UK114 family)